MWVVDCTLKPQHTTFDNYLSESLSSNKGCMTSCGVVIKTYRQSSVWDYFVSVTEIAREIIEHEDLRLRILVCLCLNFFLFPFSHILWVFRSRKLFLLPPPPRDVILYFFGIIYLVITMMMNFHSDSSFYCDDSFFVFEVLITWRCNGMY